VSIHTDAKREVGSFEIGDDDFLLDGAPFRIISGAIHYFRVHPDQWADRIHKARLMGLNTIETYVAWNEHAPVRGDFDTSGSLDLGRFLDLVHAEGLYAIVRPGPFVCAEWDNGGLPAWLFEDPRVGIRRNEPLYLEAVEEYFAAVLPIVASRQISDGGPVILVQIENEYGAYGDDKDYLRALVELTRNATINVPLTTIDQPTDEMLENGSLPGLHMTGSFGSRVSERLATLRRHQARGPLMCAEFWDGWFDHWGAHHHTTTVDDATAELDALLASGASVNLYMFHGGTNFGFTNGANDKGVFQPTTTSYDYDAPLTEAGEPGPKYWAFREVISRYASVPDEVPAAPVAAPTFTVAIDRKVDLWDVLEDLGDWRDFDRLPTLDDVGQFRGFAVYRTVLGEGGLLQFTEVRDRAQFFLDGRPIGVLSRDHKETAIVIPGAGVLDILVEDQGRVNYGRRIGESKGLIGPADLGGIPVVSWRVLPVNLNGLEGLEGLAGASVSAGTGGPVILSGAFDLDEPADLFLSTEGWGKGNAFVNGFNLGRYWSRGPQATLFVPAPILRAGANQLTIFELHGLDLQQAEFVDSARLGHTES
jgi:beta-galactosidase